MNPMLIPKLPRIILIKSYLARIHLGAIKYHKASTAFPMVIWIWQALASYR